MEWLVGISAVVSWALLWAVSAGTITIFSVALAQKVEQYLVITDRWTFPLWIVGLSLAPAFAFYGNWILWGLIVPEDLYVAVRMGCLVAGFAFAVVGGLVVTRPRKDADASRTEEVVTFLGSLLVVGIFCAALIWRFGPITEFMRGISRG